MSRIGTFSRVGLLLCCASLVSGIANARPVSTALDRVSLATAIAEASGRFGIPESWIRGVMRAESAGNPHAISVKGAMGLMQLMPATWAELRIRYALGNDPFHPPDNIMAGTAYLRELHDRYGSPGFLAAYNAGPGRYEQHLRGRPLPTETRVYVARLASSLDVGKSGIAGKVAAIDPHAWTRSAIFAASHQTQPTAKKALADDNVGPAFELRADLRKGLLASSSLAHETTPATPTGGIFVARSRPDSRP
jgi:hypothetical protein